MDRLILLGNGPSKEGCPFDCEVWAIATILLEEGWEDKPYSKLFQTDWKPKEKATQVLQMAKERNIPVLSPNRLNGTEKLPIRDMMQELGSGYWKNTASYMIAYAIYQGYNKAHLYGIDQSDPGYLVHRSYVTHWLGVAIGRGFDYRPMGDSLDWVWAVGKAKEKYMVEETPLAVGH